MVLYDNNLKMAFKFQLIWQTRGNLLTFCLLQTSVFWCLATFQTFLLYSVFLCHMQKCDSGNDMQGLKREYVFIKKLILDTDTTQFPVPHLSIISKDATSLHLILIFFQYWTVVLWELLPRVKYLFLLPRDKSIRTCGITLQSCAHCSIVTCFFKYCLTIWALHAAAT